MTTNMNMNLHTEALNGNIKNVKDLLSQPGIDINAKDAKGYTPLHYAARDSIDVVKELLPGSSWNQIMWLDLSHNRLTNIHP